MKFAIPLILAVSASAAEVPLPQLRIEPSGGGSIIHIRNVYSQPLSAFLLELVDYPGSSFSYSQDSVPSGGIPAGVEKTFPVSNMTIAAAPDYVKVQAALYEDGASSGIPEKIAQLIGRRTSTLETIREVIHRIEKAQSSGTSKASLIAELTVWAGAESLQAVKKDQLMNQGAARSVINDALRRLEQHSMEDTLAALHREERALAASKPALDNR
jgi:hypothetical protein